MIEHFIPVRRTELMELLCAEPDLKPDEALQFRHLGRLLAAHCQFEHYRLLERLKSAYAGFDPDSDTRDVLRISAAERDRQVVDLLIDFAWVMRRANYRRLNAAQIEPALDAASPFGLQTVVDFKIFERLTIFTRGAGIDRRRCRRLHRLYRAEEVEVPVWERLVMVMKLRPHPRLDPRVRTDRLYLQIFKNIPRVDINMLLPGARVRMSKLDRGKIGFPFISGLALAVYNIADDLLPYLFRTVANPTMLLWGLATGAFTYGTRSVYSYLATRQRYNLNLTQILYFQNLDTNAGVLFRVLDDAQEQECRELLLGYYFLWRHAGANGLPSNVLVELIERFVHNRAEVPVHFEINDALAKLERHGLLEKAEHGHRALPIAAAIRHLEGAWSNCLNADPATVGRARLESVPEYSL